MIAIAAPHRGKDATMAEMVRMVKSYPEDLAALFGRGVGLYPFFDAVKAVPYGEDLALYGRGDSELVARPSYLMDRKLFPRLDCKKKAILICAWAEYHGVPWKLVAVCENGSGDAHHVFPQLKMKSGWTNADATFPGYKFGEPKPNITHAWEFLP